jgi:hypothetical protein
VYMPLDFYSDYCTAKTVEKERPLIQDVVTRVHGNII